MLRIATAAMLACLGALWSAPAAAQDAAKDFPNRAIHIVVPFPAGGPADVAARLLGQKMSEDWGQPVIDRQPSRRQHRDRRAVVAKAAPDGYTLLMAIDSTLVMNQFLYKSLPYDPFNDFAPITTTTKTVSVLAVCGTDGPKTVQRADRQGQGPAGQAQLRRRHHHRATDRLPLPQGRRHRHRLRAVQGHADVRQRAADQQRRVHLSSPTSTVNPLIESGKVRVLAKLDGRPPTRCRTSRRCAEAAGAAQSRGHSVWLGLVAPEGHAAADRRQAAKEGGADLADPGMRAKPSAPAPIP